ncbi:unnamed protein product [Soboliphyme baturini]|uniref:Transmembrane protein n=1 Tax=Soboliphyme baturini TaxID=241478 RepID=A0A183IME6_9BILA|nr:unnamed protein product [Soboliphyme baturini]
MECQRCTSDDYDHDERQGAVAAASAAAVDEDQGTLYEELDPECDDDSQRGILLPIFVAMIAISLVAFLFWMIDRSKRRQKLLAEQRRLALKARREAEVSAIDAALANYDSEQHDSQTDSRFRSPGE